jgi:mannosyl-oligosaccharide alpha-1,2-mannosidase
MSRNRPNNRETLIAEVGTVQLEFMMLSQLTGNPIYGQKVIYQVKVID